MPPYRETLEEAIAALRRTAGIEAKLLQKQPRAMLTRKRVPTQADTLIEIDVGRRKQQFLAEVKNVDRFATPAQVKAQGVAWEQPPLLIAPYITRETADKCRELRLPFIDTAGNAYLEGPGFLIYIVGNHRGVEFAQER